MESNNLNDSVQNEQFSSPESAAETTGHPSSAVIADKAPTEKMGHDHSYDPESDEEFHAKDEHVILHEEVEIPEEMIDEDDNDELIHEEIHHAPSTDYSELSKEQLVETAAKLLNEKPIESIKADFESIKIFFYKRLKVDYEKKKKDFIDGGGNPEEFKPDTDVFEEKLKAIFKRYKEHKAEHNKKLEAEKVDNYKQKLAIIDEIKHLISGNESFNDTFQQFRELQKKWRSIGPVPQANVNDLWESYNHNVEKFYDFIKINKELRDLDLKKNLEIKIELCEKAEALLLEPSIIKAFRQLQEYHNKWREVGPVTHEMRAEIWGRFKEITTKINKLHQDYFEQLKVSHEKNLEAKTLLCEKAEEILNKPLDSMKDWEESSKALVELQNVWKTIGFAPRKDNVRIYQRFRTACDTFFAQKREFYNKIKEEQNNNLQLKIDLCVQVEALKDSTEWKRSTEDLLNIQKKWKEIGPVPRKQSDLIWKRFRAACDTFFNNKSAYYSGLDSKYDDNLKQKIALIEEIEAYTLNSNVDENFANLKEFQRRWTEIGFVPIKQKEEIQTRYRTAINKLFDSLKVDESKRKLMNFKNKIEHMPHNRKTDVKITRERDKLIMHLKKLESDIVLWENNIGFFAKSKNAEALIKDVQGKIDNAKSEIKLLEEKIRVIDSVGDE